jgi:hypothetical protein
MSSLEDRLSRVENQIERLGPSISERVDRLEQVTKPPKSEPPSSSSLLGRLATTTKRFLAWLGSPAVPVKITGQFFIDAHHISAGNPGGNGGTKHCATNVWEIHPVTDIEVQSQ